MSKDRGIPIKPKKLSSPNNVRMSFAPDFEDAPLENRSVSLKKVLVPKDSLGPSRDLKEAGARLKTAVRVNSVVQLLNALKEQRPALSIDDAMRRVTQIQQALEGADGRIDNNAVLKASKELHNMARNVGDFVMIERLSHEISVAIKLLCNHVDGSIRQVGKKPNLK